MMVAERFNEHEKSMHLSRAQIWVTAIVVGFALLPFFVEVVWGEGVLLRFLNDGIAYTVYVLLGGAVVAAMVDYFIRRARKAQAVGSVEIGRATGMSLRLAALVLIALLDIGLWWLFFLVTGPTPSALGAALAFHLIWFGTAMLLKHLKRADFVLGVQIVYLPLLILFLLILFAVVTGSE